jgi:large subunit ribosomal protein L17
MNLASSLIVHKRIKTTVAKAKALRQYVEPLITKSKNDTTHSRRVVFSYLRNKKVVTELFREVSQKVMNRQGGYTRIIKLEPRLGDNAELCYIELVDYNENLLSGKTKRKATRRRKKSSTKKTTIETTLETQNKEQYKDSEEVKAVVSDTIEENNDDANKKQDEEEGKEE